MEFDEDLVVASHSAGQIIVRCKISGYRLYMYMPMYPTDTIQQMREKIWQVCLAEEVRSRLCIRDDTYVLIHSNTSRLLNVREATLKDYGIMSHGHIIQICDPGPFRMKIIGHDGRRFSAEVSSHNTVGQLKKSMGQEVRVPPETVSLYKLKDGGIVPMHSSPQDNFLIDYALFAERAPEEQTGRLGAALKNVDFEVPDNEIYMNF